MRIAILYDGGARDWSDEDIRSVLEVVGRVGAILRAAGHEVVRVPARHGLRWLAPCRRADLVFNLCEGLGGVSRFESAIVGTLELTGVPFTGAGARTMAICHSKPLVNAYLHASGVPTPRWIAPQGHGVPDDFPLPAIVKPAAEDASVGIDQQSVATTRRALAARVAKLSEEFDEIIVQAYVPGREFGVGIVGAEVLPISEIDFSRMPEGAWPILSFDGKWKAGSPDDVGSRPMCPARVSAALRERIVGTARRAWRAVGGRGYGRVDIRLDADDRPWVLEVNPNPDISEDAGLARMAAAHGWTYEDLVLRIAETAAEEGARAVTLTLLAAETGSRADLQAITRAGRTQRTA